MGDSDAWVAVALPRSRAPHPMAPTVLLAACALSPAFALAGEPPPTPTPDAESIREEALALYGERCGVRPGTAREHFALADWERLIDEGRTPADLLDLAQSIPTDCTSISFRAAVLVRGPGDGAEIVAPGPTSVAPVEPTAPPPGDVLPDPAQLRGIQDDAIRTLGPVTTMGWAFTATGLTFLGVGLGAILDGHDAGPLPTIGNALFMTSLFVSSAVGAGVLRTLPWEYRHRPLRTVTTLAFVIGVVALAVESAILLVAADTLARGLDDPFPSDLIWILAATAYGGLITASVAAQLDNTLLLARLKRDTGTRGGGVGLVPLSGGAAALLTTRW